MSLTRFLVAAALLLTAAGFAHSQAAETPRNVERQLGDDHFAAGGRVRISQPVGGDLFAAGGSVDVSADVTGEAVLAGGQLRLDGSVGRSAYLAGGQVVVAGRVAHNLRVGGGRVELLPGSNIAGNLSVGGGSVRLDGRVQGYVQAAGGSVLINGTVDGDVVSTAGKVELGPNARIGGQLRYASREEVVRDPAAQVASGVERMTMPGGAVASSAAKMPARMEHAGRGIGFVWTAGLVLLAVALVALAPGFTARTSAELAARPGLALLLGFVALVCIPIAALVLTITLIGIPIALLVIAAYPALLLGGYVIGVIGIGQWLLRRFGGVRAAQRGWQLGAAALAVLLLAWLGLAPWLGGLLMFAVLLAGVGVMLLQTPTGRRIAPA